MARKRRYKRKPYKPVNYDTIRTTRLLAARLPSFRSLLGNRARSHALRRLSPASDPYRV